jgi:predicted nucleic acid-binding protein
MVLVEVFNGLATRGAMVRDAVVTLERGLRNQANVTVVPQTSTSFREAVAHFAERLDQQWSLTDCSSFLIMRREGIIDALAHDRDFEQAGFRALLRDP